MRAFVAMVVLLAMNALAFIIGWQSQKDFSRFHDDNPPYAPAHAEQLLAVRVVYDPKFEHLNGVQGGGNSDHWAMTATFPDREKARRCSRLIREAIEESKRGGQNER